MSIFCEVEKHEKALENIGDVKKELDRLRSTNDKWYGRMKKLTEALGDLLSDHAPECDCWHCQALNGDT